MIGFTSTSLRPLSVEEVVNTASKAGAEIIEWGSDCHVKTAEDAKTAKKLCDESGIICNSYGTYYRIGSKNTDEWKKICEAAAIMGSPFIRTWLGTQGSKTTSDKTYDNILDDSRIMSEEAKKYALIICNECHPNTFNDTTESSLKYLKDVGCDNIKTYYQSWYRNEPEDKEKLFALYPYVQDVHLSFSELTKFQRFHKKDEKFIEKILSWLKELKFDNGLMIEFVKNSSAENLIKDTERLKNLWKNV